MKVFLDVDPSTNLIRGWGSTPINKKPIEVEIEDSNEFLNDVRSVYIYVDGKVMKSDERVLDITKKRKISDLRLNCKKTILGKFSCEINGKTYFFSCDENAQTNFEKVDRAFEKGRISSVGWTAYNADGTSLRLELDAISFEPLYNAHLEHILSNKSKFRDSLEPKVKAAKLEDIDKIKW